MPLVDEGLSLEIERAYARTVNTTESPPWRPGQIMALKQSGTGKPLIGFLTK